MTMGLKLCGKAGGPNGKKKFEATFLSGEEKSRQSWDASGAPIHEKATSAPTTPAAPKNEP